MLKFRKLTAADLQTEEWSAFAPVTETVRDTDTVFAAFTDGVPAGILIMPDAVTDSTPVCAIVDKLVVRTDCRRQGIGRILMALAAGASVDRQLWFLAAQPPETKEAAAFCEAIHLRRSDAVTGWHVLDLSDVEGLRYG